MFSKIHTKFGSAGLVVAVIALIVALGGAALAKGVIVTKLNQISPKVQKQLKGKRGPEGPAGLQGAPGPTGARGEAGSPGKSGSDGIGVTSKALSSGDTNCPDGGTEFKAASGTTFACNGAAGPIETKLPSGKSLKGLWQIEMLPNPLGNAALMTVNFPLAVEPSPAFEWVPAGTPEGANEHCPGVASNPKAEPGYFCLYDELLLGTTSESPFTLGGDERLGYRLEWTIEEGEMAFGYGSWAVTA